MAGPELSGEPSVRRSVPQQPPSTKACTATRSPPTLANARSLSRSVSRLLFPLPPSWLAVMLSLPFPWFAFWVSFLVTLARSQSPVQTFFPGSIPLANRSPYLSAWHASPNGSAEVSSTWPLFWDQKVRALCL